MKGDAVVTMFSRWLRTWWHPEPCAGDNRLSQSAAAEPPCAPEWAAHLPTPCNARTCAAALATWARQQPDLVGHAVDGSSIIASYKTAWVVGWPPLKDFLRELAFLMPRRRRYRRGTPSTTVYFVPLAEVVPIAQRKRA